MDSPALRTQRAVCTVKYMTSFGTWRHRFDVDSNFLSHIAPLVEIRPKCNQFTCWWKLITCGKFHRNPISIRANRKNADIGTRQTSGQRDCMSCVSCKCVSNLCTAMWRNNNQPPPTEANSAFRPFGVDGWVVSYNGRHHKSSVAPSGERLQGKGRHWCNVQVKLCDPYLSALSVRCYKKNAI